MDVTASRIHDNRMAVAAAGGAVALLLFWFAVGWGFLGSLLAGIVVFALLLLLIGWIGVGDAADTGMSKPDAVTPKVAAKPEPRVVSTPVAADGGAKDRPADPGPALQPTPTPPAAAAPMPAPSAPTSSADPVERAPSGDRLTPEGDPLPAAAETPASPAVPVTVMPAVETTPDHGRSRPATLDAPRDGTADDLKRIKGIGPKLEALCNRLGFWHFDQIAGWSEEEVAWVDEHLEGFRGRVQRDDWVAQSRELTGGGATAFSSQIDKGAAS